jgi:hypothetical protein
MPNFLTAHQHIAQIGNTACYSMVIGWQAMDPPARW